MDWLYIAARNTIIIELVLTTIIIIAIYLVMLVYFFQERQKQQITANIAKYFAQMIPVTSQEPLKKFPKEWQKINLIAPVLYQFSKLVADESWKEKRENLISNILLPLAREAANSKNWVMRFFAAVCFNMIYIKGDEKYIINLVKDQYPIIRLNALNAAIAFGSSAAINSMITMIAKERWLTQTLYLQAFESTRPEAINIIKKRLQEAPETTVKATCYNILLKYPPESIDLKNYNDVASSDLKLKIAVIRFIAHVDKTAAKPMVINLLAHQAWQARTIALYCLYKLRAVEIIPQITQCLNDPNEWVRFYAAEILKNLEDPGSGITRTRDINEEQTVFDFALNVIDTL